jgi:methylmalonyl-CoA/ethylmalonyl-CoA epimerase
MNMQFHHIGYATRDIEEHRRHFEQLGYTQEGEAFSDPEQKIRGCFLTLGTNRIELLEPTDETSPLWPYIRKDIKMYHLAYVAPNLEAAMRDLQDAGAVPVTAPKAAVAFHGRRIVFFMLRNQQLIEIIEA